MNFSHDPGPLHAEGCRHVSIVLSAEERGIIVDALAEYAANESFVMSESMTSSVEQLRDRLEDIFTKLEEQ